jgi:hypothetical protein
MRYERRERRERREPNVLLLDPVKGWHLTYRESPPKGEPLRFRGKWVQLCVPDGDGIAAVELPAKGADTPERAYGALHWPEVKILFGMKHTLMEKLDRGLWLGALGILAFLTFMLVASLV